MAAVAYGFISRKLRTEGEAKDVDKIHAREISDLQERHTRELAYLEARRAEERDGRIAAERRVTTLTERWDRALDLLAGIEKELIRGVSRDGPNASR